MVLAAPSYADTLSAAQTRIDGRLSELVPERPGDRLNHTIRHGLLAPGKRLRPSLAFLVTESLGGDGELALDPGCAIEMVHSASLIVDDLPCMDDAELRRGRRATHVRFGMETALLASLSLLNRAPAVIASSPGLDEELRLCLIRLLADCTGDHRGLAAGQLKDLEADPTSTGKEQLEVLVAEKTGALFSCAVESGALVAGADRLTMVALRRFARSFSMCFQALDDLADLDEDAAAASDDGDRESSSVTFVSLLGVDGASAAARGFFETAMSTLAGLGLAGSGVAQLTEVALASRDS